MKKKNSILSRVFSVLLGLIVAVGVLAVINYYNPITLPKDEPTTEDIETENNTEFLYVKVDGNKITTSSNGNILGFNSSNAFEVFGSEEVSISIVPNKISGKDFVIKVGDVNKSYFLTDLRNGFDLTVKNNVVTLKTKGSLLEILKSCYGSEDITIEEGCEYEDMFRLIFKTSKAEIFYDFSLEEKNITLNEAQIIF